MVTQKGLDLCKRVAAMFGSGGELTLETAPPRGDPIAREARPLPAAPSLNDLLNFGRKPKWQGPAILNPDSKIATPHLDRLAREGMRFTDAHSGSAVCTPTRYGLLTGRYCWRTRLKHRVLDGFDPPRNAAMWDLPTLKAVARHCRRGATLATWTVAGTVRRELAQCGFSVQKADADTQPIMWLTLASDAMSLMDLTDYMERYLLDRFATRRAQRLIRQGGIQIKEFAFVTVGGVVIGPNPTGPRDLKETRLSPRVTTWVIAAPPGRRHPSRRRPSKPTRRTPARAPETAADQAAAPAAATEVASLQLRKDPARAETRTPPPPGRARGRRLVVRARYRKRRSSKRYSLVCSTSIDARSFPTSA